MLSKKGIVQFTVLPAGLATTVQRTYDGQGRQGNLVVRRLLDDAVSRCPSLTPQCVSQGVGVGYMIVPRAKAWFKYHNSTIWRCCHGSIDEADKCTCSSSPLYGGASTVTLNLSGDACTDALDGLNMLEWRRNEVCTFNVATYVYRSLRQILLTIKQKNIPTCAMLQHSIISESR